MANIMNTVTAIPCMQWHVYVMIRIIKFLRVAGDIIIILWTSIPAIIVYLYYYTCIQINMLSHIIILYIISSYCCSNFYVGWYSYTQIKIIIIVLYLNLFCIPVWHAHDKIQANSICFDICELPSQTNALLVKHFIALGSSSL